MKLFKKFVSFALLCVGVLFPTFVLAALPSESEVSEIQARLDILQEDPGSFAVREGLTDQLDAINEKYGYEGLTWVGYKVPQLMGFILDPSVLGVENVVLTLLPMAKTRHELADMMTFLFRALEVIDLNSSDPETLSLFEDGMKLAAVDISEMEAKQLA